MRRPLLSLGCLAILALFASACLGEDPSTDLTPPEGEGGAAGAAGESGGNGGEAGTAGSTQSGGAAGSAGVGGAAGGSSGAGGSAGGAAGGGTGGFGGVAGYGAPPEILVPGANNKYLLRGMIVTPETAEAGEILVESNVIVCVGADCSNDPKAQGATVIESHGMICPGMIDTHNHIRYNVFDEDDCTPSKLYAPFS